MHIGKTIRSIRKSKKLSQKMLSEQLGVTRQAVSKWECGKNSPDISLLPQLVRILGVSADTLLGLERK